MSAKGTRRGDLYWDYQRLWRRFLDSELDLANGEATYSFDLAYGGEYVLSVTLPGPERQLLYLGSDHERPGRHSLG